MTKLKTDRLSWLKTISLGNGNHKDADAGACVMEAVAYIAGEPWSHRPQCACPIITSFSISWNDGLPNNAERDRLLKPIVPKIVGTRSTPEVEQKRGFMSIDWMIRQFTPAWLEMVDGLKVYAEVLRKSPEITNVTELVAITPIARAAAWAAASAAAWGTASAAARAAAWAAASAAARAAASDAACAAARDAAWDTARAAASDAARDAAWAAASAAASDAASDALKPTTEKLQQSALELVKRMIEVTAHHATETL